MNKLSKKILLNILGFLIGSMIALTFSSLESVLETFFIITSGYLVAIWLHYNQLKKGYDLEEKDES